MAEWLATQADSGNETDDNFAGAYEADVIDLANGAIEEAIEEID